MFIAVFFCACTTENEIFREPEIKKSDYKYEEVKVPENFKVPKRTVLIDAGHDCIGKTKCISQDYL